MILNRTVSRCVEHFLRNDKRDIRHDAEIRLQRSKSLLHLVAAVRGWLKHRQAVSQRCFLQWIDPLALFFRRTIDGDDLVAALQ
jgi:hypothetical protein